MNQLTQLIVSRWYSFPQNSNWISLFTHWHPTVCYVHQGSMCRKLQRTCSEKYEANYCSSFWIGLLGSFEKTCRRIPMKQTPHPSHHQARTQTHGKKWDKFDDLVLYGILGFEWQGKDDTGFRWMTVGTPHLTRDSYLLEIVTQSHWSCQIWLMLVQSQLEGGASFGKPSIRTL